MCKINRYYAQINNDCAFPLVPALDAGAKKPAISIRCIWPALTRSRVKRGSYMVFDLFYRDITDLFNRCLSFSR